MCQDSEDEWVEAEPQTKAVKAWQVSQRSNPSEKDISPAQKVEVSSMNEFWICSVSFVLSCCAMTVTQKDKFKADFKTFFANLPFRNDA